MDIQMTLEREPAELVAFSLAVQETLRAQLGDSLVDSARAILEKQHQLLKNADLDPQPVHSRLPLPTEKALLSILAEIVLADGVVCSSEEEAANTYILDHLAVNDADGDRLLCLYEQAKSGELAQQSDFSQLETGDREAIYDACCKVAWADHQLKPEEAEVLQAIAGRLSLEANYAQTRLAAYGDAVQQARVVRTVYTHIEVLEPVQATTLVRPAGKEQPDWLKRSIELLAIHHLTQKKGARINAADPSWCSVLDISDRDILELALRESHLLNDSAPGFVLKTSLDEAERRSLQSTRSEATLLRLLLGNGSALTSRFLSFRMSPPKAFPELELIRLAENSPALVRYRLGSGKWLGARAWGPAGAAQLVKEDWTLIKRELKKSRDTAPFSRLEWKAIQAFAQEQNETDLSAIATAALS